LIAIAVEAQLKINPKDWIQSHQRVNTQPSTRLPFDEFIKQLDQRGVLISGEKFFLKRTSLMDAMPACWINLSVERRHSVLSIIKGIYERATANEEPVKWTKEDVLRLTAYVKMDEVYKLRACYLVAKKDPSVIVGTTEEEDKEAAEKAQSESEAQLSNSAKNIQDFFSYHPRRLLDKHKANRNNKEVQCKLFDHLTNYTAQSMWDSNKELEPSSYLDAFMSDEQKTLLKPTYKNCLMGYILYDVKGKGATQKLAKR